jgi:hypothetical protein
MIIQYGHRQQQGYFGLGVMLLLEGDGEVSQTGQSIVGIWSKVTYLEARNITPELNAGTQRQNMEARNAHLESH